MYRARARKRARLDVIMHGIPTSSVAPRGTPSAGVKGGRGGTGVSETDVDRETASADSLRRGAMRMLAEEAQSSLAEATREVNLEIGNESGSVAAGSFPFPLTVLASIGGVSRGTDIIFALGDSPGFPTVDFLGTIFLSVEGEVEVVDRRDTFEVDLCAGLVLSLVGSGSGGTAFFGFVVMFVLTTEVVDVRLGLLAAVAVTEVAVAVVFTLTVETVDETELRRGRDVSSPGKSELVLLNVDEASLR